MRGRSLNRADVQTGSNVAVIAESTAHALFPNRDPLGATFGNGRGLEFTVVGIVPDTVRSLDRPSQPLAYVIPGDAMGPLTLLARARVRQDATLAAIRREVSALAPGTPVTVTWWSDDINGVTAYRNPRFQTLVLGSFATLALGLTALGIFGVVAFLIAARTHEMGIRMAIGATPRSLVGLMVRQTLVPVGAGLVLGLMATRWVSQLAEQQLFKVETRDRSRSRQRRRRLWPPR